MRAAARWLQNVFIPHEGNGHQPHILRPRTIAFVCLVALVGELGFLMAATYVIPRTRLLGLIDANALVDETNQQRQSDGVGALTVSPLLTAAAQDKANDMAQNGYFAHTSPSGLTPWYWFEKVGYAFSFAGENLAVNFTDSQEVTNAWMNSPEHRANILDGNYTEVGIATAEGTYDGKPAVYVAEEFGTPAAAPIAFVNTASAAESAPPSSPTSASAPTSTAAPSPTVTTVSPAPAGGTFTVTIPANKTLSGSIMASPSKTAPKPSGSKTSPAPKAVATVPAVVSTATAAAETASATQPISLTVPAALALSATTTENPGAVAPAQPAQANAFQRLLANPAALANDFYFALMALFLGALIINVFVKMRIQFPRLIFGGMLVVVVAGLLVLYNQNLGILHAVIL